MRILCANCGVGRPAIQVSRDFDSGTAERFLERAIRVRFVFDGEIVDEFFLSPEHATENSVAGGDHDLPDQYPLWVRGLKVVCAVCHGNAKAPSP